MVVSVGHDHHFLERLDRVETDHVEAALGLYRNHEAVHFVLEELHLAEGVERVALSLGTVEKGPYVVLARNGHFVTCLGEGMSTGGLDVIPRERLEALLRKHRDRRGRESVRAAEQRKNERTNEFFIRMFKRGRALTREEFIAFSAFQPLMGRSLYAMLLSAIKYVLDNLRSFVGVEKVSPAMRPKAELFHNEIWFVGHCALLTMMGERAELDGLLEDHQDHGLSVTLPCATLTSTTMIYRGAWAAARLGKHALPMYKRVLANADSNHAILDGVMAVLAIGLRSEGAKKDARRILESIPPHTDDRVTQTRVMLRDNALMVLDDPEKNGRLPAITFGREAMVIHTRELPEGDPFRYADQAAVPEDLAITAALMFDVDWHIPEISGVMFATIALAAKARVEDFYFPRELARRIIPDWTPEDTLEHVRRFANTVALDLAPARKEVKIGRNEPCFCGSGKKYKKCHGG